MSNTGEVIFNTELPTSKQGELDLPPSLLLPRGSGLAHILTKQCSTAASDPTSGWKNTEASEVLHSLESNDSADPVVFGNSYFSFEMLKSPLCSSAV